MIDTTINMADETPHNSKLQDDTIKLFNSTHIAHYTLLETIGMGGMSTVYRAIDTRAEIGNINPIALKLIHPHFAKEPDFAARFLSEGQAIVALQHPHIVRVSEVGQADDELYLAMEYIEGKTLRQRLNDVAKTQSFLDLREIVTIARQIAQSLDYAHRHNVIHRDVKPDNVLLRATDNGSFHAMLTDFGLAQRVDTSSNAPLTGSAELLGTLPYMSPELFRQYTVDARVDIYALGVMLYELVTGIQPFRSDSSLDLILMHTQGEPEPILNIRPDTPPSLVSIIMRAMQKNPEDRYETTAEIARQLEGLDRAIQGLNQNLSWTVRRREPVPSGVQTRYEVLPMIDPPAIPVDLISEGADDMIIIMAQDGNVPHWTMPLEKSLIIVGRDSACDLHLDDPRVSRRHLRIDRLPDGRITIVDLESVNGVFLGDMRLEKNKLIVWGDTQSVKVGPYWLTLRLARTAVGIGRRTLALTTPRTIEATFAGVTVRMTPAETAVEPGSVVTVKIEAQNTDSRERVLALHLDKLEHDWYTLNTAPMLLPARQTLQRTLTFHPPRNSQSAAQRYDFTLHFADQDGKSARLNGALQIFPYYDFSADVTPRGNSARIMITNLGNSQRTYIIEVRERENALIISPSRTRILAMPGQTIALDVRMNPKRRALVGILKHNTTELFVRTDGLRPQTIHFDFTVNPWIPWWALFVILMVLLALGLFVLFN